MALPAQRQKLTTREYLELDRAAERKSEFLAGEMFAMAGASEAHNLIVANLVSEIRNQLRGKPCRVYPSDMRVRVEDEMHYAYPDVTALCGRPEFEDDRRDILLNPQVIIEVLSPSTEGYDRGRKFLQYRKLASLTEYLLVSQEARRIEKYERQPDGRWLLSEAEGKASRVEIQSIGCSLLLSDVYEKVE
jgi:Uma2 family endonuclease